MLTEFVLVDPIPPPPLKYVYISAALTEVLDELCGLSFVMQYKLVDS